VDDVPLVQVVDSFEDLAEDLPFEFFVSTAWILLKESFKGLSLAKLHLDVQDSDAVIIAALPAELVPLIAVDGLLLVDGVEAVVAPLIRLNFRVVIR